MIWRLKSLCGFAICTLAIAFIGVFLMTSEVYAYSYELSSEDAYKITDYFVTDTNNNANLWKSNINSIITYWGSQVEVSLIRVDKSGNHVNFYYLGLDKDQITSVNNVNNPNYMTITYTGSAIYRMQGYHGGNVSNTSSSDNNYSVGTYSMGSGSQLNTQYILYNNDLTSTVPGPYQNLNILTFVSPVLFEIDLNTNSSTQYVFIDTDIGQRISNIAVLNTQSFGEFFDDTWLAYWYYGLDYWHYNGSTWTQKRLFDNVGDFVRLEDNSYINFTYYSPSNVNYEEIGLYIKDLYAFKNVVFHFQIINGQNDSADCYFILSDSNTVVSNGTLDTTNFGNDYYNQFSNVDNMINNNNNTQDIIDNINNGDEVESIVDEFLGESGEELAVSLGYNPMTNTYAGFIYGLIDDICDTLYDSGDVYFDYTLHGGEPYRIYSSDIYLPNGALKTFISGFLIFGACFIIYRHFKRLIDAFNSADLGLLINYDVDDINIYYL